MMAQSHTDPMAGLDGRKAGLKANVYKNVLPCEELVQTHIFIGSNSHYDTLRVTLFASVDCGIPTSKISSTPRRQHPASP